MKRLLLLIICALAASFAGPAHADWENTRWGSNTATVMAIRGPAAHPVPPMPGQRVLGQDLLVRETGEWQGLPVEWRYHFDAAGALTVVQMRPIDSRDCNRIGISLANVLRVGEPGGFSKSGRGWASRENNLTVMTAGTSTSTVLRRICLVTWQPYGDGLPGPR